ncbi:unnamed protein product, partial [Allacma fusca]
MRAFNNLAKKLVAADFSRFYCKGSGPGGKKMTKRSLEVTTSAHKRRFNFNALKNLVLTMDSKKAQIPATKVSMRAKLKQSPNPGMIFLQVLGTGANGSPASLYIFADEMRYICNYGEGSQRLPHEHKLKLGRLENSFVTSKQWDKIGATWNGSDDPGHRLTGVDVTWTSRL